MNPPANGNRWALLWSFERLLDRIVTGMGYLSGGLFLVLSFYMTIDVTSRRLGGPFTGVTDDVSGYVLALGGTWALAYALTSGAHVRIDVFLHLFSVRAREFLRLWGVLMAGLFAVILTFHGWALVAESYRFDAHVNSMFAIALYIPQSLSAIGFTILAVQAFTTFLTGIIRFFGGAAPLDSMSSESDPTHPHASI